MGWLLIRGWALINFSYLQDGRLFRGWALNRINMVFMCQMNAIITIQLHNRLGGGGGGGGRENFKFLKALPVTAAVKSDPQASILYCWSGKDSIPLGT